MPRARHPLRDRRQRARVRASRLALQHAARARAGGSAAQAPQADADHARAPLPRHRRRRRPRRDRHRSRADRRLDLLGEPDAAGALRRLPRRAPGVGRTDRRRLRGLAGEHAAHRDRGGRLRGLGAAVHPRFSLSRGLPGAAARGQGGVRQRRRGDRRARPPAGSSPAPCTERRGSSSRTAISAPAWWPSAGSTLSATTAARTSSRVRAASRARRHGMESRRHTARRRDTMPRRARAPRRAFRRRAGIPSRTVPGREHRGSTLRRTGRALRRTPPRDRSSRRWRGPRSSGRTAP